MKINSNGKRKKSNGKRKKNNNVASGFNSNYCNCWNFIALLGYRILFKKSRPRDYEK